MINSKGFKGFKFYEKFYETEIDAIKQELKKLPAGNLVKQGAYYYEKVDSIKKGITKDQQRVMQLARKAYLLRRLEHLEWNYSLAKKQFRQYKTEAPMEIVQGLPSVYQSLPVSYFFHPSVHDQIENATAGNVGHPDQLVYLTDSGVSVRSKSELIIANALDQNGIPFRYEAALALGGVSRYPDFTIYRPFDGKMFLWEHLGLMDQDEYRLKTIEKLILYAKYGFFPFDNLICTYEHDIRNPSYVHEVIEAFLLQ